MADDEVASAEETVAQRHGETTVGFWDSLALRGADHHCIPLCGKYQQSIESGPHRSKRQSDIMHICQ